MNTQIETKYKGYKFKSPLAAKWAVFFDELGLPYEYKKEGFDIGGEYYVPGLWVPVWNAFIEIKREQPTKGEIRKAKILNKKSGKKVLIFSGLPWPKEYSITSFGLSDSLDGECHMGTIELRQCRRCANINANGIDKNGLLCEVASLGHPEKDPKCKGCGDREPWIHDRILKAYKLTWQTGFEYDEIPF